MRTAVVPPSSQFTRAAPVWLLGLALCLGGCSGGPASVQVEVSAAGAAFSFASEGRNSFTVAGATCEALEAGTCQVTVAAPDLQPGWNELTVETRRRTPEPVTARFFVGEELYARTCQVGAEGVTGDPSEQRFLLSCTFPEGFHGEVGGAPLRDGRATVPAMACLPAPEGLEVDLTRPMLRGEIPLDVVGRGGGRLRRGVPVAVPAPLVQASLTGWASPWFEDDLPLRVETEEGASIHVDGVEQPVGPGGVTTLHLPIPRGPNDVFVVVSKPGRAPARHGLAIEGRTPDTPLTLDQSYVSPVVTDQDHLPLSGRTHPDARLYLNGRPVEHHRGRFELQAFLEQGKNDVQLLAAIEAGPGRSPRPVTRIDIEVHRDVQDARAVQAARRAIAGRSSPLSIVDVAVDPWSHLQAPLSFPMRIEAISENLSTDGTCTARIQGLACSRRVTGPVMVGWTVDEASVCIGAEVPVVVEAKRCPEAVVGDEVEVLGAVQGAQGGLHEGVTRDRPVIAAVALELLPRTERLSIERRAGYRPARLEGRPR